MRGRRGIGVILALVVLCASTAIAEATGTTTPPSTVGIPGWRVPTPCTGGAPTYGLWGACALYNQATTWYGTYGPGFPSQLGWVVCAWPAASGGWYPAPGYDYQLTDRPSGSTSAYLNEYGYALSEAANEGLFANVLGWSANDMGQAAKLLYDAVAWQVPLVADPGGVTNALAALYGLYRDVLNGGGPPVLSLSLPGGASSFAVTTTATVQLRYPTSGLAMATTRVLLGLTNATFDANHSNQLWVTTDTTGSASVGITASTSAAVTVSMSASASIGRSGLEFYRAAASYAQNAQDVAAPLAAATSVVTAAWTSEAPPPPRGRLALMKEGNLTNYLSVAGAIFDIRSGANVVATLVTNAQGRAGPTEPLLVGSYTLHEVQAPPGYQVIPDRTIRVVANTITTISLTGANEELVLPADVSLHKVDDVSGAPLAGAVLEISYDAQHDGTYSVVGDCTTDSTGSCIPPGNYGAHLLPGYYKVVERTPPPGYQFGPEGDTQYFELSPGETGSVTFADDRILTTLYVAKHNAAEPGQGVPDATYDLYVVGPPPSSAPDTPNPLAAVEDNMTYYATGVTDHAGHLGFTIPVGFSWCVVERSAPPEWVIDPAVRCTGVINEGEPDPVRTIAVGEHARMITLGAQKYNASAPDTVIPGASYALFVQGAFPPGFAPPSPPSGLVTPPGTAFFALSTTDANGALEFSIPAGFSWCLKELVVPEGYLLDDGLHCTGVLRSDADARAATLALPELPTPATTTPSNELPATGGATSWPLGVGLLLAGCGIRAWLRRRRRILVEVADSTA